jgi:hypothetical protein
LHRRCCEHNCEQKQRRFDALVVPTSRLSGLRKEGPKTERRDAPGPSCGVGVHVLPVSSPRGSRSSRLHRTRRQRTRRGGLGLGTGSGWRTTPVARSRPASRPWRCSCPSASEASQCSSTATISRTCARAAGIRSCGRHRAGRTLDDGRVGARGGAASERGCEGYVPRSQESVAAGSSARYSSQISTMITTSATVSRTSPPDGW